MPAFDVFRLRDPLRRDRLGVVQDFGTALCFDLNNR